MCYKSLLFWAAVVCAQAQTTPKGPLCTNNLRYGGTCMDHRATCPAGTFEYNPYSNYLGCVDTSKKCCANNPQGTVKNPNGIIATPPLDCGIGSLQGEQPTSRILDGVITGACDWPFVVSFRAKTNNVGGLTYAETSHACSGVLISREYALTSPACLISAGNTVEEIPSRVAVVAGEYNVSGIDIYPETGGQQEQMIRISDIYIHPDYPYRSQEELFPFSDIAAANSNGVALVKLAEPVIGRCAGIACLPSAAEAANDCAAYDECVITGWGFTTENFDEGPQDELMLGGVRLTSGVACDFLTQRLNLTRNRPQGTICQNPRNRNTDSCLGDEGGPVLCSNGYNWVVRGIIPFNLCRAGNYALFVTNVAPYLDWIQSTMASGSRGRA
ncbi:hypothetical protein BsWGS_22618 [Bradybaena similaris]